MATILGIGIATIDIINEVSHYPAENDEVRALTRQRTRGGNATNTLTVLAALGHHCQWAGTLVDDGDGDFVRTDLQNAGVGYRHCNILPHGAMPTSYILLNRINGSRTIVHYRDLPEFDLQDTVNLPWHDYTWLHFEGRNVAQTRLMLAALRTRGYPGKISIEIEKSRDDIGVLYEYADLLIFSRQFALHQGFTTGPAFLSDIRARGSARGDLVCAWGETGAYGLDSHDSACCSPAYPPSRVIDTLGAGDVFNAGLIHGLLLQHSLATALGEACALAGKKCGQRGLRNLLAP